MLFNSLLLCISWLCVLYSKTITAQELFKENEKSPDIPLEPVFEETEKFISFYPSFDEKFNLKELLPVVPSRQVNKEKFEKSISPIKLAIEYAHEKHEKLVNLIKCQFPDPPKNCSSLQPQASKWDWGTVIPSEYNSESFFDHGRSLSEQRIISVTGVFQAALDHINNKQNKIYEFISCACKNNTACSKKLSWINVIYPSYWYEKFQNLKPIFKPFNWNIFGSIHKPNRPVGVDFEGSIGTANQQNVPDKNNNSLPNSGGPSQSSAGAKPGTGFIVAVTGGKPPSYPSGIFGSSGTNNNSGSLLSGFFSGSIAKPSGTSYSGTVVLGNFPLSSGSTTSNNTNTTNGSNPGEKPASTSGSTSTHTQTAEIIQTQEFLNHTTSTIHEINNQSTSSSSGQKIDNGDFVNANSNVTSSGQIINEVNESSNSNIDLNNSDGFPEATFNRTVNSQETLKNNSRSVD